MGQVPTPGSLLLPRKGILPLPPPLHTHTHTHTHLVRGKRCGPAEVGSLLLPALQWAALSCPVLPVGVSCHMSRGLGKAGWDDDYNDVKVFLSGLSGPKPLKVGIQQQNILFSWTSRVKWAGKQAFFEWMCLVTRVLSSIGAYHQGSEVASSRFQYLGLCRLLAMNCLLFSPMSSP